MALKYIDTWLDANFANSDLPGMQVAVWHGGKIQYSRAFGYANLDTKTPLTPKHLFRVASQSKMFTTVAIIQLAEAGKLRLDDAEPLEVLDDTTLRIGYGGASSMGGELVEYTFTAGGTVDSVRYAGHTLLSYDEATTRGWF